VASDYSKFEILTADRVGGDKQKIHQVMGPINILSQEFLFARPLNPTKFFSIQQLNNLSLPLFAR